MAKLRTRIASGRSFASLSLIKNPIAISRPIRVTEEKTCKVLIIVIAKLSGWIESIKCNNFSFYLRFDFLAPPNVTLVYQIKNIKTKTARINNV